MRNSRLLLSCMLAVFALHATNAATEDAVGGNSSAIVAPELLILEPQFVVETNISPVAPQVQHLADEELQSAHDNTSARKVRQFGPGPGFGYKPYPPPFGYAGYGGGFGGGFGRTRVITRTRTRYVNRGFGGGYGGGFYG